MTIAIFSRAIYDENYTSNLFICDKFDSLVECSTMPTIYKKRLFWYYLYIYNTWNLFFIAKFLYNSINWTTDFNDIAFRGVDEILNAYQKAFTKINCLNSMFYLYVNCYLQLYITELDLSLY